MDANSKYFVWTIFFGVYSPGEFVSKRMAEKVAKRYVEGSGHRWAYVTLGDDKDRQEARYEDISPAHCPDLMALAAGTRAASRAASRAPNPAAPTMASASMSTVPAGK